MNTCHIAPAVGGSISQKQVHFIKRNHLGLDGTQYVWTKSYAMLGPSVVDAFVVGASVVGADSVVAAATGIGIEMAAVVPLPILGGAVATALVVEGVVATTGGVLTGAHGS